jgi:hypothetical protein
MQLKKASKKTTNATEKPAVSGEAILSPETPKARAPKSAKAKKSEGAEMTSGKNLHKPATPAISVTGGRTETTPKIAPPVEAKPVIAASKKTVTHEEIAALAYTFWLERDGEHGFAEHDWLRAERELNGR